MTRPNHNENPHNDRWLNNPERRVGREQLLRATLAGLQETDPLYDAYRTLLESPENHTGPHR